MVAGVSAIHRESRRSAQALNSSGVSRATRARKRAAVARSIGVAEVLGDFRHQRDREAEIASSKRAVELPLEFPVTAPRADALACGRKRGTPR
jgi:hypothetical protein